MSKTQFFADNLKFGEIYAGLVLGQNGAPDYHLILLPGEAERINWTDANAWAKKAGGEFELADRGLLLKAAEILAGFGNDKTRQAKTAKSAEDAHERAMTKATTEAKALMKDWPTISTLDRVALVCTMADGARRVRHELERLGSGERTRLLPQWGLTYLVDEARQEIPRDIAYAAVTKKQPVAGLLFAVRTRFDLARSEPGIARLAAQFDEHFKPAERAAA